MARNDSLFLTKAQLAGKLGIDTELLDTALPALRKAGFPQPDQTFGGRYYWPACRSFLDRRYGIGASSSQGNPALDGEERW